MRITQRPWKWAKEIMLLGRTVRQYTDGRGGIVYEVTLGGTKHLSHNLGTIIDKISEGET